MNLKQLVMAIGAVTLMAGGGTAAAQGGNGGGPRRTVHVQSHPATTPTPGPSEPVCAPPPDPSAPTIAKCVATSTVTATQAGDGRGTTVQALVVGSNGVDPHHLPQSAIGTFDGTVNGCGQGGFLYVGSGTLD